MKQRTALMKLYAHVNVAYDLGAKQVDTYTLLRLIKSFDDLEKEQIMKANIDGYNEAQNYGETSAEDYYNNTYIL
jgi:hypothetical protein